MIKDEVMEWLGFGDGFGKWQSKCRVRVYKHDGLDVVVATELKDNRGSSIGSCVENLAMMAIKKFGLDFKKFVWIEHYPRVHTIEMGLPKLLQEESFSSVNFGVRLTKNPLDPSGRTQTATLTEPAWRPMKKDHVESMIGEKLDD